MIERFQDAADAGAVARAVERGVHAVADRAGERAIGLVVERLGASLGAVVLHEHAVADGVDERAELAGVLQLAEVGDAAGEDLLAHLVDGLEGAQAPPQLEQEQVAEVGVKMLRRPRVPLAQPPDVLVIEDEKFHFGVVVLYYQTPEWNFCLLTKGEVGVRGVLVSGRSRRVGRSALERRFVIRCPSNGPFRTCRAAP